MISNRPRKGQLTVARAAGMKSGEYNDSRLALTLTRRAAADLAATANKYNASNSLIVYLLINQEILEYALQWLENRGDDPEADCRFGEAKVYRYFNIPETASNQLKQFRDEQGNGESCSNLLEGAIRAGALDLVTHKLIALREQGDYEGTRPRRKQILARSDTAA